MPMSDSDFQKLELALHKELRAIINNNPEGITEYDMLLLQGKQAKAVKKVWLRNPVKLYTVLYKPTYKEADFAFLMDSLDRTINVMEENIIRLECQERQM